ncbi:MAG: FecR family protein [Campylobacterota bacterium]|nr:FecR family protein [Campylobacterota bacterium]
MKILLLMIVSLTLWANIGNVMAIKGSADVKRQNATLNATNGMVLHQGDRILTSKKSRVQVMLKDSTIVTIGANASFSFEEFSFDGTKNSEISMRANRGFFRSVTGKIGKIAPERFKVKTASATIGIRGTDFSGEIFEDREVFKCYKGAIFIEFSGELSDISEGMMMEILQNRFEIKEFDASKVSKSGGKNLKGLSGVILESIDGGEIPTEVITDITQIVEDSENNPPEDNVNDNPITLVDPIDPTPADSFTVDPNTEDRQVSY